MYQLFGPNARVNTIWTSSAHFTLASYASEVGEFELAVRTVEAMLFGRGRIYLEVKKRIGAKGSKQNIPDGYLIDLSGVKPKLYVVENELARHETLKHIAVQILEFSLAFESEPRRVRQVLLEALALSPDKMFQCEAYSSARGYRNLDHLLDDLVHSPFNALVIIDQIPDRLLDVLSSKFAFGVEVLELKKYTAVGHDPIYLFEPFLADIEQDILRPEAPSAADLPEQSEIDTVVVPAREDGFREVFLAEDRWYKVRLHGTMRPQIKHIAVYQVAPISAITHVAPVKSIEPWEDSGKFVLNFSEPAREIGPIKLQPGGRVKALQNLRYTTLEYLEAAKTLDEVW